MVTAVVVERSHPQAFRAKQPGVDVGHRSSLSFGESLRLGEQHTVLPDHSLAVPGQVGRRLTLPGRGVDIGGQAAQRSGPGQQASIFGAADRDRAAGQIDQHRRARQRRFRAGRNRHEHVLTDFDVQHEVRQIGCGEQQVWTERRLHAGNPNSAALVVTGRHLAALVELPVGGQVRLGRHPKHNAAMNDHGSVVDPVPVTQRGADHQHRQQLGGSRDDITQGVLDGVEQHVLQQDVLDGVPGQRQLREDGQGGTVVVALASQPQHRRGIGRRVADRGVVGARGDTGKALAVGVVEIHRPSILAQPVSISGHWVSQVRPASSVGSPRARTLEGVTACPESPELIALLAGRRIAVLTGAGISTDSGIPDYRGPDSPPSNPMTIRQFTSDPVFRQRYWARNHVGWRHMDETLPNAGHRAVAALERDGVVAGVVTQNVDLLHTKAGSQNVINLHGTYAQVICLSCADSMSRAALGEKLDALNPGFVERAEAIGGLAVAPDADAVVADTACFRYLDCPSCGGMLKPDIVYFGESVPKASCQTGIFTYRSG